LIEARVQRRNFAATTTRVLLLLALGLGMLGDPARAEPDRPLRVLAAASLTEVALTLAENFDKGEVVTIFGPTSTLARQLRDGAPGDVFLSASPEWIDFLAEANALAGEPIAFARNHLVCIAPRGRGLAAQAIRDADSLRKRLASGARIAIADPGVPAGEYARASLREQALLDAYAPFLVGQRDVRAVLNAVEQREVEAGFVYATDARVAEVDTLFTLAGEGLASVEYQAAVLRAALSPEDARRFLDHLRSPASQALLAEAGFALP
jgi:molybdate transport system substrate-binding protein